MPQTHAITYFRVVCSLQYCQQHAGGRGAANAGFRLRTTVALGGKPAHGLPALAYFRTVMILRSMNRHVFMYVLDVKTISEFSTVGLFVGQCSLRTRGFTMQAGSACSNRLAHAFNRCSRAY